MTSNRNKTGLVQVENEVLRAKLSSWLHQYRASEELETERGAREYLEEWCSDRCGWLRRTLPPVTQVPVFELTAATEKALLWLEELRGSPLSVPSPEWRASSRRSTRC